MWTFRLIFLSLRIFGLLSSSLLFPQRFGWYVLRPSSGVCRTRDSSRNFELREEVRRTYQPKHCGNNNKDEDNSPKILNDKNQQASSQKFRQLIFRLIFLCSLNFCLPLCGIKYSYLIQIICKQIYLTHSWELNRYYHSISEWIGE